ncbi:MAG: hypothetical protein E7541_05960 [Ruminococcaceae bacterium]|nr:hypothetical protein [Oscillospiraceae bacterium]
MQLIASTHGEKAYSLAAKAFAELYQQVTAHPVTVTDADNGIDDLVVIGTDATCDYLVEEMLSGRVPSFGIRYGTDDYCIRVVQDKERYRIYLAGGRGRSTLYAVYDFFERFAGCHYFWDGDVIPQMDTLPLTAVDEVCSPRFMYRGLRYFAHRGLWRFQAEHWNLTEWKQELDWMVKRRLNFFMLRIGMDDLWQRAFPDTVPYPEKDAHFPGTGYNDRRLFWSLQYRGELRRQVLAYARDLDLLYPEDCGTLSHWYSPAPDHFLDTYQPHFLPQADEQYVQRNTRVWDIRQHRNMELYMKLTEASVTDHAPHPHLFHTIGMAERNMYADREQNLRLKLFGYRKIAQVLRERYPHSKLMLASWDFIGWWKGEEVQSLLQELDPERTLILDYTSEVDDPRESFLHWGLQRRFPWIFGLFHAYEPESTLRGPYRRSDERLAAAKEDPFCQGMILWPELSHSDPIVLEYLAENAWSPLSMSIEELTARFCQRRYSKDAAVMNTVWQTALPLIMLDDWGGYSRRQEGEPDCEQYTGSWVVHREMWPNLPGTFYEAFRGTTSLWAKSPLRPHLVYQLERAQPLLPNAVAVLRRLSTLPEEVTPFLHRDRIDLARTIVGRTMNRILLRLAVLQQHHPTQRQQLIDSFFVLLDIIGDLLGKHDDFSLYATLRHLEHTEAVPECFEETLKRNLLNGYCRQQAYEPAKHLYPAECHLILDHLRKHGTLPDPEDAWAQRGKLVEVFMERPLATMQQRTPESLSSLLTRAATILSDLRLVD